MDELSQAFGAPLEQGIVLLDPHDPDGYVRDWHPPGLDPARHWAYAVQWWAFAAVLLFLWVRLNLRKLTEVAA
jgi:surfeit locus 1 family protein